MMETPKTAGAPPEAVAAANMRQLIRLRWLAVAGQLATVLTVGLGLGVPLPMPALLAVIAALAAGNVASALLVGRRRITNGWMVGALLFDLATLAFQLYLTGGAANPFVSLFLVQVVLGAILLEAWSAWALAAVACAACAWLSWFHLPLVIPEGLALAPGDLRLLGEWIGFALASVLLVFFSVRITRNLRASDAWNADLRARAAEEDHLVRMGLFASGAAHELGTPLATLSVILGDWRRLPRIAADAELSGEVAEMEAEVARCKAIVTDILQAAGAPRGEALGRASAAAFLDEVVAAWRAHGAATLRYERAVGDATLLADPALRQAIWNLLDNAAEASTDGITLDARVNGELIVAVADRGAGLPPAVLARLGQPVASRKGPGHGVGLFLAAAVARRLGGRLEAANGRVGAEVRLVLPVEEG